MGMTGVGARCIVPTGITEDKKGQLWIPSAVYPAK